jgi:ribonuclease HI
MNPVQSFLSIEEADAFLAGAKLPSKSENSSGSEPTKFYAIARGRAPGVYTDWSKAQEQIKGFQRPRFKRFATRAEAEEFVRMAGRPIEPPTGDSADDSPSKPLSGTRGLTVDNPRDEAGVECLPGTSPLPPGAEDGFDPNLSLNPKTGKLAYKTQDQRAATKTKPPGPPGMLRIYTDGSSLQNGTSLASAGVGVYFGPGDSR